MKRQEGSGPPATAVRFAVRDSLEGCRNPKSASGRHLGRSRRFLLCRPETSSRSPRVRSYAPSQDGSLGRTRSAQGKVRVPALGSGRCRSRASRHAAEVESGKASETNDAGGVDEVRRFSDVRCGARLTPGARLRGAASDGAEQTVKAGWNGEDGTERRWNRRVLGSVRRKPSRFVCGRPGSKVL